MKHVLEKISALVLVLLTSVAIISSSKSLADEPWLLIEEIVVIGLVASDIEVPRIEIPSDLIIEDIPIEEEEAE